MHEGLKILDDFGGRRDPQIIGKQDCFGIFIIVRIPMIDNIQNSELQDLSWDYDPDQEGYTFSLND